MIHSVGDDHRSYPGTEYLKGTPRFQILLGTIHEKSIPDHQVCEYQLLGR